MRMRRDQMFKSKQFWNALNNPTTFHSKFQFKVKLALSFGEWERIIGLRSHL